MGQATASVPLTAAPGPGAGRPRGRHRPRLRPREPGRPPTGYQADRERAAERRPGATPTARRGRGRGRGQRGACGLRERERIAVLPRHHRAGQQGEHAAEPGAHDEPTGKLERLGEQRASITGVTHRVDREPLHPRATCFVNSQRAVEPVASWSWTGRQGQVNRPGGELGVILPGQRGLEIREASMQRRDQPARLAACGLAAPFDLDAAKPAAG